MSRASSLASANRSTLPQKAVRASDAGFPALGFANMSLRNVNVISLECSDACRAAQSAILEVERELPVPIDKSSALGLVFAPAALGLLICIFELILPG